MNIIKILEKETLFWVDISNVLYKWRGFCDIMLPELLSLSSGKNDLLSTSGLTWGVCGAILALCFSVWSRTTIVVVVEPPTESYKQILESKWNF